MGKKWRLLHLFLFFVFSIILLGSYDSSALVKFSDTPDSSWYSDDLKFISTDTRSIIAGYPDGTFRPAAVLTAEQFITMVVRASGYNLTAESGTHWSTPYFLKAIELGYIEADDFYQPSLPISRGEMASIITRAYVTVSGAYDFRDGERIKPHIEDYSLIPNGFKDAVVKVYDMGIITGYPDGTFGSSRGLTRAEATAVVRRMIDVAARKPIDLTGIRGDVYQVNENIPAELYEYDYTANKSNNEFFSNIWMVNRYGLDRLTTYMDTGKGYFETFYNVNYKSTENDQFISDIRWFFMPNIKWRADDGVTRTIDNHFNYWLQMVNEKEITINLEFITDPSLVYSNNDTIVRGLAIFTVEHCNDMNWLSTFSRLGENIEVGKTYKRVIEAKLINMAQFEGWNHAERVLSDEYFISPPEEVVK